MVPKIPMTAPGIFCTLRVLYTSSRFVNQCMAACKEFAYRFWAYYTNKYTF